MEEYKLRSPLKPNVTFGKYPFGLGVRVINARPFIVDGPKKDKRIRMHATMVRIGPEKKIKSPPPSNIFHTDRRSEKRRKQDASLSMV